MERIKREQLRESGHFLRPVMLVITVALSLIFLMMPDTITFRAAGAKTRSYEFGTVVSVTNVSNKEKSPYTGRILETETVKIRLKDRTVTVTNQLSDTHYIRVHKGSRVLVSVDSPKGVESYYTLFNYNRTIGSIVIFALFALLMIAIGGKKGAYSMAALVFAVILIFRVTVPMIYNGVSALPVTALTVLLITLDTILLLQGANRQSLTSIAVVFAGEILAAGLFALFSVLLHISGFNDGNVDSLLVITQNTGMDLTHILFSAAMISSLGAVMDVAVSLVSAVFEVSAHNHSLTAKELFRSGMNVGRDMMGTMSNTLILAFTGSALSMLLVLCSYGVQPLQLLSSDTIAVEIAHGICGTAAVILTVPLASAASALALGFSASKKSGGHF
ncbi:MAG: YibE/F family protein [Eubacteriales bacterium]|nr:YibE/F family protein [Eubacteriales bacterium]